MINVVLQQLELLQRELNKISAADPSPAAAQVAAMAASLRRTAATERPLPARVRKVSRAA